MTVLDLIKRSLRLLGAINIGDQPTGEESADALAALNGMVEAWATERLMMYTTARNLYPLVAGQQVYTIGPSGADWTAPRPMYIDTAGLIVSNADPTQVLERPLKVLRTDKEWARIRMKAIPSTLPTHLYYDHFFNSSPAGAGNIALWPVPSAVYQVALYTPLAISQFTAITQTLSLPPGYYRALVYNLAIELAPEFDREPSDVVVAIAEIAKSNIKRANVRPNALRPTDALIQTNHGGDFDWMLGEIR